jgi:hypothetical protein
MLARIYRPAKNAMQSGKAGARKWRLEFEAAEAAKTEALMGWTSSPDALGQVRISFDSKEQAIAFARAHGLAHDVVEPPESKRIIKAYADNFAFKRKEPWSH